MARFSSDNSLPNVLSFSEIAAVTGWRNAAAARDPAYNLLADPTLVTASSDAALSAAAATDGSAATAFVSADAAEAWAEFRLYHTQTVSVVVLTASAEYGGAGLLNATVELLSAEHEVVAAWRITPSLADALSPGGQLYLYAADGCMDVRLAFEDFATRLGRSYRCVPHFAAPSSAQYSASSHMLGETGQLRTPCAPQLMLLHR